MIAYASKKTLGDLEGMSYSDFLKIRNIEASTLGVIVVILKHYGIHINDDTDNFTSSIMIEKIRAKISETEKRIVFCDKIE